MISTAMNLAEQFDLIEHVVAIGVGDAIDAGTGFINAFLADHHVEAIEGPQQPVRMTDRQRERLHLHLLHIAPDRRRSDPHHAASSIRSDQPPLAIDTHRNPRPFGFIECMQQLDTKTFRHLDGLGLRH